MFNYIVADLRCKAEWRGLPPTSKSLLKMCFCEGSAAQLIYRAMRFCQTHHLKPLAMLFYRYNSTVSSAVIGRGADFGPGFVILHSFGIVINSQVKAGKNLILEHGVTLGSVRDLSPLLGDDVYIGAGAKVIGAVRIGNDVKIGANAVVTKDVPDGATVVGIPARVVKVYGKPVSSVNPESLSYREDIGLPDSDFDLSLITGR